MQFLMGYKTYVIAFMMVGKGLASIARSLMGDAPEVSQEDVNLIMEGLAIAGLRQGVAGLKLKGKK